MQDVYVSAATQTPPVIMGWRMRPLSVGHCLLLEASQNSFYTGTSPVTVPDVLMALEICSRTYEDGAAWLASGKAGIGARLRALLWARRGLLHGIAALRRYMESYSQSVDRWAGEGEVSSGPRVQWQYAAVYALCNGDLRADTVSAMWNMPLDQATVWLTVKAAANGDRSIVSPDEWRVIDGTGTD